MGGQRTHVPLSIAPKARQAQAKARVSQARARRRPEAATDALLALQRSAGNGAVSRLLQRDGGWSFSPTKPAGPPDLSDPSAAQKVVERESAAIDKWLDDHTAELSLLPMPLLLKKATSDCPGFKTWGDTGHVFVDRWVVRQKVKLPAGDDPARDPGVAQAVVQGAIGLATDGVQVTAGPATMSLSLAGAAVELKTGAQGEKDDDAAKNSVKLTFGPDKSGTVEVTRGPIKVGVTVGPDNYSVSISYPTDPAAPLLSVDSLAGVAADAGNALRHIYQRPTSLTNRESLAKDTAALKAAVDAAQGIAQTKTVSVGATASADGKGGFSVSATITIVF